MENQAPKKKISFINAQVNCGQGKRGTELGPKFIKQELLIYNLQQLNCEVHDRVIINDSIVEEEFKYLKNKNIISLGNTNKNISKAVSEEIESGFVPVILGGDHSLAIGSVNGTATTFAKNSAEIGVIWIDAHADINTPLTTSSGNLHGQPVSFLLYELEEYVPKLKGFEWVKPCLAAKNLVYIGLRDVDEGERILIDKFSIKAYSMSDVQQLGIRQVVKETLEYLTRDGELLPLHLSVDIDSLDPWFAPSTGTPVMGGLTLPQLMYIGNCINDTGKLRTLDIVEVNPLIKEKDTDIDKTVFSAVRTLLSFFGYDTIGTINPNVEVPKPN